MKNNRLRAKRIAFLGIAASLALLLSYVELLLPPLFVSVPGIKLGLPNVVIIYVLYCLGMKYAVFVSMTRLIISSLLFGNVMTLAYSVAGAALSLLIMGILKKTDSFSKIGVKLAQKVSRRIEYTYVYRINIITIEMNK